MAASRLCQLFGIVMLPLMATASVSTTMAWNPSTDPNATGYNIYYGAESHNYTNMISVGNVTSITIGNLAEGTTYYFAAKARDNAGDESDFSNEAIFAGYNVATNGLLELNLLPSNLANDQVVFSLAAGAPAGVSINPTTGVLSWNPDGAAAKWGPNISVIMTDLTNPSADTQVAVSVTVSGSLTFVLPSMPVQTGQATSLPLTLISSSGATHIAFTIKWPGDRLLNPILTFIAPIAGGTLVNQGTNLLVQLWTASGDALTGSNQIAQINFQAAVGQSSTFISVPVAALVGTKADGSTIASANSVDGEIVVIGVNPLLRSQTDANQNRTLTVYAKPGIHYQLQQSSDLSSPSNWQPLQEYQPTNMQQTISLDSANPMVFYRLMQE